MAKDSGRKDKNTRPLRPARSTVFVWLDIAQFVRDGMTWADSDLIQVQENVIAKTVNSLTFAPQ